MGFLLLNDSSSGLQMKWLLFETKCAETILQYGKCSKRFQHWNISCKHYGKICLVVEKTLNYSLSC